MSNGWIKLHRAIKDNPIWNSEPHSKGQAWADILIEAGHSARKLSIKGQVILLERGQKDRSELTLSKTWKWSRGKVRRFLKLLESESMILQKTGHLTSVITVCNYDIYQSMEELGGTTDGTPVGTAVGHHTVHKQECNNVNNGKKESINTIVDKPKRVVKPESWKAFFNCYPANKKGATDATAWKKAKSLNLADNDFILMAQDVLHRSNLSPEWLSTFAQGITKYIGEQIWLTPLPQSQRITYETNKQATRKLSLVERVAQKARDREAKRETNEQPMGDNDADIWPQVGGSIRGRTIDGVVECFDGD